MALGLLLQMTILQVERAKDGSTVVTSSSAGPISASKILVAKGRKARTDECGLEMFGIPVDGTSVQVDESLPVKGVSGNWLYAAGDINGRSRLTHMCKYQS